MLAQNFKTAADLDITEGQKDALIKTLVLLETGKLIHAQDRGGWTIGQEEKFTGHFNMGLWNMPSHCGTIGCIGGTAELISGENFSEFEYTGHALDRLFFPRHLRPNWNLITPEQAATALRSYLTTGEARWDLAVSS